MPKLRTRIVEDEWSFKNIGAFDSDRAARLEACPSPEALIPSLADVLAKAIDSRKVRFAVDSKDNAFVERRAIVQFQVSPELYDWFFNARTGYRAQFWINPETGAAFNSRIVDALGEVLRLRLPEVITVRCIEVITYGWRFSVVLRKPTGPAVQWLTAEGPESPYPASQMRESS
jgi:hypothetical protein